MTISTIILGGTGFGAGELLRLLTQHPAISPTTVVSRSFADKPISAAHPHLRGFYDGRNFVSENNLGSVVPDLIFSALPTAVSGTKVAQLRQQFPRARIVDLSGDLRLLSDTLHNEYYPKSAPNPELRKLALYGLPELQGDRTREATLVANPGCLATAATLAVLPLAQEKLLEVVSFDGKTGSSGAGRELSDTSHHPTRHANCSAYKPLAHQHEPEIVQALGWAAGDKAIQTAFVAHRLPISRGIYMTAYATLSKALPLAEIEAIYQERYAGCPFVRISSSPPELQNVVGTNMCELSIAARGNQVVVMAAIDNLIKGMAGQAIQNANLMFGLEQDAGLRMPAWRPC